MTLKILKHQSARTHSFAYRYLRWLAAYKKNINGAWQYLPFDSGEGRKPKKWVETVTFFIDLINEGRFSQRVMEQLRNFGDERQTYFCVYCGCGTETRDHVPSRVFLDEPYPANLPVIPACQSCNKGFSIDEEYVACLIGCALTGSTKPDDIGREKIRQILERKPALVARFCQAHQEATSESSFNVETERVRNVILKLAKGHAAFELNEPQLDEPSSVAFIPFPSLSQETRNDFETPPMLSVLSEVGSRATQRLVISDAGLATDWIVVQPGRYRYLVFVGDGVMVRIVISEYLCCEVMWG